MPNPLHNGTVVHQPEVYFALQRGIDQMVGALRPTLGPYPRLVAIEDRQRTLPPELLDDGATIARRIISLPDRTEDMGAMYLRHVLWTMHQRVGDGTATAAVLFGAVIDRAIPYLVAGGSSMSLRRHLEAAARIVLGTLHDMAQPVSGREQIGQIAASMCFDEALAERLGEIFDRIGPYGHVDLRSGQGRDLTHQYVQGSYWLGGARSPHLLRDKRAGRTDLDHPAILLTDRSLDDPDDLLPVMQCAAGEGRKALLVVAGNVSDRVLGLMLANQDPARFQVIAASLSSLGPGAALEDMAALAGGRVLVQAAGDSLRDITPADLGHAQQAWVTKDYVGLLGGGGDPQQIEQHIATLQAQFAEADSPETRSALSERLGKLTGGTAVLWVGGATKSEIEARKQMAQRTVSALRGAILHGMVPGGGAALLACRSAVEAEMGGQSDPDARAACRIVSEALTEPLRVIASNAGIEPGAALAAVAQAGPGCGFDVRSGQAADMLAVGILDPAVAIETAAYTAIVSAALALTVDVLVHHLKPDLTLQP